MSWWAYVTGTPMKRPVWELYDLRTDRAEIHNLAAAQPEVVAKLRKDYPDESFLIVRFGDHQPAISARVRSWKIT